MADSDRKRGIRLRRLRLAGSTGNGRSYEVSFLDEDLESWRPLSIIAGPTQTGKTSVADFVRYCLGDDEHPQHPEILANVRAALLEAELDNTVTTIERAATGSASKFASIWRARLDRLREVTELRLPTEPPSEPASLSQFVLSACDLDNIALPEAPTQAETGTQILSIRDVFKVMWMPNERLDNKNLVFEHANFMVHRKFMQTIDVIFDVHDAAGADLAARARRAGDAARDAKRVADSLRGIVQAEYPLGPLVMETDHQRAQTEVSSLKEQLNRLDGEQVAAESTLTAMRRSLEDAKGAARAAAVRVRDRQSLMERLAALRGQYADDKKKLTFLKEAERLFNPLQVSVCPACLSTLGSSPEVIDGKCSLCRHDIRVGDGDLALGSTIDAIESQLDSPDASSGESDLDRTIAVLEAEHKAVSRRLDELSSYWDRLDEDLGALYEAQRAADQSVDEAAAALDQAATLPAPYLAARDDLNRRLANAVVREQVTNSGLRLWARLQAAEDTAQRLAVQSAQLRAEQKQTSNRPDRNAIIRQISNRFGDILSDFGYPKLSRPYIEPRRLIPYVRGLPYNAASSGGLVLISLAWCLSIWEIAQEQGARAPGLLMIDSPQKNLGHGAHPDDAEFADTRLVENFYRHVKRWLSNEGSGAQLVVIDNTPPESITQDVIIRFTRNRNVPPYGLIDNATD